MDIIKTWIKNNLVTLVEVVSIVYDAIQIVFNGLARLVPGNLLIKQVHDFLKQLQSPLDKIKAWLIK